MKTSLSRYSKIWIYFLLLAVTGCAMSYGPRFEPREPSPEKALIYVYRTPSISGSALSASPMVMINGQPAGKLKNGAYVVYQVAPGEVHLALSSTFFGKVLKNQIAEYRFTIENNETQYFEYAAITTGYKRYGDAEVAEVETVFTPVPEGFALKRLEKTRLQTTD